MVSQRVIEAPSSVQGGGGRSAKVQARPRHVSLNACLAPLCALDRCHVVTVEGIGGMSTGPSSSSSSSSSSKGGASTSQLHPVQQRISEMHGSQCGFCTPGIVMALYTLLRNHPNADPQFIQENMDGNLCRCTGYRPILDAAKSLADPAAKQAYAAATPTGCCGGSSSGRSSGGGGGGGCCGGRCVSGGGDKEAKVVEHTTADALAHPSLTEELGGCGGGGGGGGGGGEKKSSAAPKSRSGTEPIFPPALAMLEGDDYFRPLWLTTAGQGSESATPERQCRWVQPTTLPQLLAVKCLHPGAKIVVGNTEVGIETKFKGVHYGTILSPRAVPELRALEVRTGEAGLSTGGATGGGSSSGSSGAAQGFAGVSRGGRRHLVVGAAVTLGELEHFLHAFELDAAAGSAAPTGAGGAQSSSPGGGAVAVRPSSPSSQKEEKDESKAGNVSGLGGPLVPWKARVCYAMRHMLRWFASNQIRAGASLAGNLATASPISDMNPVLAALDAVITVAKFADPASASASAADSAAAAAATTTKLSPRVDVNAGAARYASFRTVRVRDFFKGYRRVDLAPGEVIASVAIPLPSSPFDFVQPYKQARRREDDISIVSGAIRVSLMPSADLSGWEVGDCGMAFGGMAPTTVTAAKAMKALVGKPWALESLPAAYAAMNEDMPLPDDVPGGQAQYRRALPPSFLFKFFVKTCNDLAKQLTTLGGGSGSGSKGLPPAPTLAPGWGSAGRNFVTAPKPSSSGVQRFTVGGGGLTKGAKGFDDGGEHPSNRGGHDKLSPSTLAPRIGEAATTTTPPPQAAVAAAEAAAQAAVAAGCGGGENSRTPVGDPLKHLSADKQVSGAAVYVDDMPSPPGLLHAALILSTKAHARIIRVDPSPAMALNSLLNGNNNNDDDDEEEEKEEEEVKTTGVGSGDGGGATTKTAPFSKSDLGGGKVVRVVLAKDVRGTNHIGAVIKDEEVFATEEVLTVGQVIGVVVGTTQRAAIAGARAVERGGVEYEDLPAILTIDDAVKAGSFYTNLGPPAVTTDHVVESGDVGVAEAELAADGAAPRPPPLSQLASSYAGQYAASSAVVGEKFVAVSGDMRVGGQEHFYLEPNATLCVPSEGGDEMVVYSSTQNPVKTQNFTAAVTGIRAHKVVCRMKRMGGGFGGKETRSVFVGLAAAVAAQVTGRPVKICLDRDVDMAITGQRHPFLCRYRASADKATGKLHMLNAEIFSNGGCSLDLSGPVMDRALFHIDNAYKWPHLRCRGVVCRTNLPSNTAFRGFGGPQALVFAEHILDHLTTELQKIQSQTGGGGSGGSGGSVPHSPFSVRRSNLYSEGDETHFNQALENWNVPRCMDEIYESADVEERLQRVEAFNSAHRFRKRGLEVVPTKFGISFTAKFMNQGGALVHVYTDGTVLVTHGGTEMGQGLHTKVCQVAARVFGIPVEDVFVSETASDKVANASPSAASLSTDLYGMATLNACEEIRKRLEPVARGMMKDSDSEPPPFKALVNSAYFQRIDLSAHGWYIVPTDRCGFDWNLPRAKKEEGARASGEGKQGPSDGGLLVSHRDWNKARGTPFNYFTQGVACSEVEVDCLTGDVRILRTDILMDVGQSINPAIDVGQIEGAFVQGWGWLSMEDLNWTPRGQLFTRGPGTYKIPAFDDAPVDFRVTLLDRASNPFSVHSSKAIGEPPFFLAASAFFATRNAIKAAREHRVSDIDHFTLYAPATSERIRMACLDEFTAAAMGPAKGDKTFQPRGSY